MSSVSDPDSCLIAGKYRLESLLGEGGMGAVYRAFNVQLELPVAIKLLRPGPNIDELGERLRVEARAAAKLVHPSIVRVFDIGEAESGEPFIVMELLAGECLGDVLQRGTFSPVNALQLLLPIAEALSLAHSRGVVHRDLKPDNIFLAHEGDATVPKLLDFGIAKVTSSVAAGAALTQSGTLLGSPEYMSPEQAYGRSDIDHRSDVWSFCIVLYEAICGSPPFTGSSCQHILRAVVEDAPLPLELMCDVDPALSELILRGLAKDREARPASIFELGQELAGWLHGQGVREDATGASLEAKWLGRSSDDVPQSQAILLTTPRAQHDQATLVSVVHPQARPGSGAVVTLPIRRGRRWVPSAVVAGAALAGCMGWASVRELRTGKYFAAPRALVQEAPSPAGAVAASAPALPLEPLPVERPAPRVSAPAPTLARVPAKPLQLASAPGRAPRATLPKPAPSSLPGAIPLRPVAPASRQGDDLLDPY